MGDSIGVNFVGGRHTTGPDGATVTGVAGVVPQGNWNNVAPYSETLNTSGGGADTDGSKTGLMTADGIFLPDATVSWESDNSYASLNPAIDTEDERLMDGYLDISGADRDLTVSFTGIPYSSFDLLVYVGSDGTDGRLAYLDINTPDTAPGQEGPYGDGVYFIANTGRGLFTGQGDYVQATATNEAGAIPSNYALFQSVPASPGGALSIRVEGINSNAGIHAIQLVEASDLTLLVDRVTGEVAIQNVEPASQTPFDIDFYEITSPAGSLNTTGFRGLEARDFEGGGPAGAGDGWEVLGDLSTGAIREGFLTGSSVLEPTDEVRLGAAFTPGAENDLVFRVHSADTGITRAGRVVYVDNELRPEELLGDYNGDGRVDAADYTVWRDTLGSTTDLRANGDDSGASQGRIDAQDYQTWRSNYGSAGAPAAASAPEPTAVSTALACAALTFLAARRSGRSIAR
ncbi:hypothetical protein [Botrimarina sp.]|uniref:hypothetical protein n=1 Tax=Botrimarina sp. TaxID=2795802 RepID=UPI0032EAD1AA